MNPYVTLKKNCTRKEGGDDENQGVNKNRVEQRRGLVESWFDAETERRSEGGREAILLMAETQGEKRVGKRAWGRK